MELVGAFSPVVLENVKTSFWPNLWFGFLLGENLWAAQSFSHKIWFRSAKHFAIIGSSRFED